MRTKERDKYNAIQLSLGKSKREFRFSSPRPPHAVPFNRGDTVNVSVFQEGDIVRVSGLSKGRGFQGVVKRHGFHGGPKTHGQKNRWRAPGSIGPTAPQRVIPGRRMAGRMGGVRVTIKNLEVAKVEPEKHLLYLKGAVPGARGTLLEISKEI